MQGKFTPAAEAGGRRGSRLVALVLLLTIPLTVLARGADGERLVAFDIPRQRADLALTLFAEQADMTLIFPYDELRKRTANRLVGRYTVHEGARILLAGTGFEPKSGDGQGVSIVAIEGPRDAGNDLKGEKKGIFAGLIAAVRDFLQSPAPGQESAATSRSRALEEIVVTAQKREERYIDVPVSVSTISNETLDLMNVDNFQDLAQVSSSVTFAPSRDMRGAGVLIRGIGTTAFHVSVEPTVSTVVDGVVLGRTGAFLSALTDVERVEVLRGPQGTLFGKNASAGVVNIITRRPTDTFESSIGVTGTDDGQRKVEVMLSGPITDAVRARVNLYGNDYDGFVDNRLDGKTLNGEETVGLRGKLAVDLSARAGLLLIGDYIDQDRTCCVYTVRSTGTDVDMAYDLRNIDVGPYSTDVLLNTPSYSNAEQGGLSAELNVGFEHFVLTSVSAWRFWELSVEQDIDGIPYAGPTNGHAFFFTSNGNGDAAQKTDQFSQELRIATTAWDTVDLTAGLYYWYQDLDRHFQREVQLCPESVWDLTLAYDAPCPGGGSSLFGFFDANVETESAALFGQVDRRFASAWKASLGLRYTYDQQIFDLLREVPVPGPALPPGTAFDGDDSDTGVSGKLALQWDLSDALMAYASYTRGYKAQAFDIIFASTPERNGEPVPEETSDAYEIGLKAELLDRRLRLGVTAFHTTFNDFQGQALDPVNLIFSLTSSGTVITRGVEVDFTAKPVPNLLLTGGLAYTDAYYDRFERGPCWGGQTEAQGCINGAQDLTGGEVPKSPDWKVTLQGRYDVLLAAPVDLFVSWAYRWQDDSVSTVDQQPELFVDRYGVFDLALGVESDDGRWTASVFAKSLFDERYLMLLTQVPFDDDSTIAQALPRDYQRYVGATFKYRFGGL